MKILSYQSFNESKTSNTEVKKIFKHFLNQLKKEGVSFVLLGPFKDKNDLPSKHFQFETKKDLKKAQQIAKKIDEEKNGGDNLCYGSCTHGILVRNLD